MPSLSSGESSSWTRERHGPDGPRPLGGGEGALRAVAGAGPARPRGVQAVSRGVAHPGHGLLEDGGSVLRRRAGRGLEAPPRRPSRLARQLRATVRQGRSRRGGHRHPRACPKGRPFVIRAALRPRRCVPRQGRSGAGPRDLRSSPRSEAGLGHGAAAGGRGGRAPGRAGAIPLVLDAGQEARDRRSAGSPGVRPRLPQDGSPGGRRARVDPSRQPAPGRARVSVHPGRREGGEASIRGRPGSARTARREAAGRRAASVCAGVRAIHAGASRRGRRAAPGERSVGAWPGGVLLLPRSGGQGPGSRLPRRSRGWRSCCDAIRITAHRAKLWADCSWTARATQRRRGF